MPTLPVLLRCAWLAFGGGAAMPMLSAHPFTLPSALLAQALPAPGAAERPTFEAALDIRLEGEPVTALVRVTPAGGGHPLELPAHLRRPLGWHSLPPRTPLALPAGTWRIEACRGLDTLVTDAIVEVPPQGPAPAVALTLRRFRAPERGVSANTHLHLRLHATRPTAGALLRQQTDAEAYLRTTTASDDLDLVYVSHLERAGETQDYVSNRFTPDVLRAWSGPGGTYVYGQEHRHEGGRSSRRSGADELRYGHVLFLDLPQLVPPASYGAIFTPGARPDDSVPLRRAILEARARQGTIVWCHGRQGTEEIPNWIDGLLHAQNIHDGGSEGSYEDVFYPYLNAGFRVPFSSGTDWGVYDFSRVYVPRAGAVTSAGFLRSLAEGRSFITNGPLLEWAVDGRGSGETLALAVPGNVRLRGRAAGRDDFVALEVIWNGRVIQRVPTARASDGSFAAEIDASLPAPGPGWFALRVPATLPYNDRSAFTGPGANVFGKALFAHTSAVYVTVGGRGVREPEAVAQLVHEARAAIARIEERGAFADAAARERVLGIYRAAIATLERDAR